MKLNEKNFLLYAMHHYQNVSCVTLDEFQEDLKTFTYIKKQLGKQETNQRLLLNHIIILFNIFGDTALNMLFYRVEQKHWGILATYLVFINRMPEEIPEHNIKLSELSLDSKVVEELRKL
jgi:hypothetical protein